MYIKQSEFVIQHDVEFFHIIYKEYELLESYRTLLHHIILNVFILISTEIKFQYF